MVTFLATYVHQIDPYAIRFWEGGPIRWYGLSYIAGFLIGALIMKRVATVGRSTVDAARVFDMMVTIAIGVMIGGRLGYVLFYKPSMLWTISGSAPFWDVLALNKGGMASHGGMIGAILACLFHALRHGHNFGHILDLAAYGTPIGLFVGRISNFVNGELYGKPCDANLPWAVKFPQEISTWNLDADPDRADALMQAVALVDPDVAYPGPAQSLLPDLLNAIQNGHLKIVEILAPHITARHPSQLYQALLEGLLVFIILAIAWMRPRKPYVICGLFLFAYGAMRVIGEIYRLPDGHIAHLEAAQLNISRGQLLSIPMIVSGLVMVWHFGRKPVERMGGWRAAHPNSIRGSNQA